MSNYNQSPLPNRVLTIAGPASGNKAPVKDRRTVFAANADAAYIWYASMRYVVIGINVPSTPAENNPDPIIGTILPPRQSAVIVKGSEGGYH